MNSAATRITVALPRETVSRIDEMAAAQRRSRSNMTAVLLAAGQARLEELDRLARDGMTSTSQRPEAGATEAGRAHLAEHRRMCGVTPSDRFPEETKT
ncbi:MAG TPA: ribbon-helix-helix protein, CopG family [Steroidobacteraceae bacterium]|nr:ribbon-helix-helix protein, CopG family [Steroidobacteraceae bacterium]